MVLIPHYVFAGGTSYLIPHFVVGESINFGFQGHVLTSQGFDSVGAIACATNVFPLEIR